MPHLTNNEPIGTIIFNLLLLAGCWVGHAYALTVALNIFYSFPFHKRTHNRTRKLVGVLVLLFPVVAAWVWTHPPEPLWARGYVILSGVVGWLVLPAVTLARALRKPTPLLMSERGGVIDFAARLGAKPIGDGLHRSLAKLPYNQIYQVEYIERELQIPRLPAALDGLTILHLTDLHYHGTPDRRFHQAALAEAYARWGEPDVIALTGDVVDSLQHHRWILRLLGPLTARSGKFAILGNHDLWQRPERVRRRLTRAGYTVLGNRWQAVTIRGVACVVIGNEGPWFRPALAVTTVPAAAFRLALSHTPDGFTALTSAGVDLTLAGHVHGGQVRVPILGSLFVPSFYSRRYDCGVFEREGKLLVVGRGLAGKEPLRWGCRPEIGRVTLRGGP